MINYYEGWSSTFKQPSPNCVM
ncbi:hypothetical protein AAFF_G00086000 [Aldrovandia affinis]|uniref:Uncharacterized protein n=1 Tax=Aldrovandia affinis TaxID=143900 RepID=A0AAD7VXC8_9TELE|nr:hypothetical protein AAFF_G00086000 [Aldrovandia affinis]